jgi:hypothetical protein
MNFKQDEDKRFHITVKMLKDKNKKAILQAAKEKVSHHVQEKSSTISSGLLSRINGNQKAVE